MHYREHPLPALKSPWLGFGAFSKCRLIKAEIKLAQQRARAVNFVQQMRLCGAVVASVASKLDTTTAVAELKTGLGRNWSPVTAFQFMSGNQAKFAAECCEEPERE